MKMFIIHLKVIGKKNLLQVAFSVQNIYVLVSYLICYSSIHIVIWKLNFKSRINVALRNTNLKYFIELLKKFLPLKQFYHTRYILLILSLNFLHCTA